MIFCENICLRMPLMLWSMLKYDLMRFICFKKYVFEYENWDLIYELCVELRIHDVIERLLKACGVYDTYVCESMIMMCMRNDEHKNRTKSWMLNVRPFG